MLLNVAQNSLISFAGKSVVSLAANIELSNNALQLAKNVVCRSGSYIFLFISRIFVKLLRQKIVKRNGFKILFFPIVTFKFQHYCLVNQHYTLRTTANGIRNI